MNKFILNTSDRIRLIIGAMAICLSGMEYFSPSEPLKTKWLKALANSMFGERGYEIALLLLGLIFLLSVLVTSFNRKEE